MSMTSSSVSRKKSSAAAQVGASRLNDFLAVILLALAGTAPIPLGANHPLAWALTAAFVAAVGLAYGIALILTRDQLRVSFARLAPETVLGAALLGFMLVQLLPAALWGGTPMAVDVEGNAYPLAQISIAPGMTVLSIVTFAGYALYFLLLLQVTANRRRAMFLSELVFLVFVAHAIWGLASLTLWNDSLLIFEKWAYRGAATGTFVNRNSFGTFLAIGFVLGLGLTLRAALRRRSENGQRLPRHDEKMARIGLMAVGTVLILSALLATQSRMGMGAGFFGALVLLLVAVAKSGMGRRRPALLGGLLAAAAAGAAILVYGGGTLERLGSVENDADVRLQLYAQVLDMIGHNWAFGTGAGTFEVGYPLFHRWPVSPDVIWDKAHNTYLTLWSELGVVFGSIPMLIMALLGLRLFILIRQRQEDWWLPAIALAALVVVAIHSLVDFSLEIQGVVYILLFVLALGIDLRAGAAKPAATDGTKA